MQACVIFWGALYILHLMPSDVFMHWLTRSEQRPWALVRRKTCLALFPVLFHDVCVWFCECWATSFGDIGEEEVAGGQSYRVEQTGFWEPEFLLLFPLELGSSLPSSLLWPHQRSWLLTGIGVGLGLSLSKLGKCRESGIRTCPSGVRSELFHRAGGVCF